MSETDPPEGTNPFIPTPTTNPGIPSLMPRARRPTQSVSYKTILLMLATIGSVIAVIGAVYAFSSSFGQKADKAEVEEIKKSITNIRLDVNTIKTEQRLLIERIAPGLRTGDN